MYRLCWTPCTDRVFDVTGGGAHQHRSVDGGGGSGQTCWPRSFRTQHAPGVAASHWTYQVGAWHAFWHGGGGVGAACDSADGVLCGLQRALWNPLYVLETFLGPSMCRKVVCVLVVIALAALVVFGGPLLSSISPAVEFSLDLPEPLNYVAMSVIALIVVCLCTCLCVCVNKCRRMGMPKKRKKA